MNQIQELFNILGNHMTNTGRALLFVVSMLQVTIEKIVALPFLIVGAAILLIDATVVCFLMPGKQKANAARLRAEERKKLAREIWKK